MDDDAAIRFDAQVYKVQTLIDGGVRLTLDLCATDTAVIMALINARTPGIVLSIAAVAIDEDD